MSPKYLKSVGKNKENLLFSPKPGFRHVWKRGGKKKRQFARFFRPVRVLFGILMKDRN